MNATPESKGAGARLLGERLRQRSARTERGDGIAPVSRDEPLPLSFSQQRLWLLDRLRPGGTDYLVPVVLRLTGQLRRDDLARALGEVVARHEILRTRYETDGDGNPVQVIDPPAPVPVEFVDLRGRESELEAVLAEEGRRPFDLQAGPVLRARVLRLGDQDHVLSVVLHHIAVDGWSTGLLVRELAESYTTPGSGAEPPIQYADFAAWQREHVSGAKLESGTGYWIEQLDGLPPLELRTDRPRPATWNSLGDTVTFEIPAATAEGIAALGRTHRATPFMAHLAALWAVLSRYSGQTDFAVGTPVAGRTRTETENLIGVFINMLVLRADLGDDPSFAELLDRARGTAIDAYAHQDVPFERLVDALAADRDLSTHPLFQVNLVLQNTEVAGFEANGLTGTELPVISQGAKFDLTWTLEERPDGSVAGEATFPHALFDRATIERLARHYVRALDAVVAAPGTRISDLPLLSRREYDDLVRGPVGTAAEGPCLHERFAAQARERPGALALRAGDTSLSYAELDARANQLAHRLRALGLGREDLVGICLHRSANTVVALLAALKAGCAYLPLDPGHPAERIEYVLDDADARVVVTENALTGHLPSRDGVEHVVLDDPAERERLAAMPVEAPETRSRPADLAYVIYTSGSTGQPKGVQVTHANVVRLLTSTEQEYRFGPDDRWALFHSYAFDVSVWEIWGAFLYGGGLVVVSSSVARSPWELAELLADEEVTVLNQTPSAFHGLVELADRGDPVVDRLGLRLVILAGEPLDVTALAPWWKRFGDSAAAIVNKYGITETTVHTTYRPVVPADLDGDRSPIGHPVRDLTLYILDARMRPVPVGVAGEIYVGGPGVTRGYLGRPGLTASRYVPDPYGEPGARLYRSGDKARFLANGDIGFLGRFDDQVKIRGFRIELGEVESVLSAHADVETAVVVAHQPPAGERRLVTYVLPKDGATLTQSQLRGYANDRLPGYMVPSLFVLLTALPLTVNGKVDRRALPDPDEVSPDLEQAHVAPRTPRERMVAEAWSTALQVDRIGVHDNFFALGGDSIRAVRLIGLLRDAGQQLSVQDLFRHQTVADLARHGGGGDESGEEAGTAPFALVGAADRKRLPPGLADAYPMSVGQAGMVYEMLADPGRNLYHNVTSYLIRDKGAFDEQALRRSVQAIVDRHEVLRTSFDLASYEQPMQLVHAAASPMVTYADLRALSAEDRDERMAEFRRHEHAKAFAVTAAPLVRIGAHRVAEDRWYLTLTECHAVLDGWSHNSIISELLACYRDARAGSVASTDAAPPVRYADFIAQEQRSLKDPRHREFWAGKLDDAERLTIPSAWADPDDTTVYEVSFPLAELGPGLRRLAGHAGASLKSVLLAAHVAVWRFLRGHQRFYCGLVSNGRTEVRGGDEVRGMFLNTVPFLAPEGTATWSDLVRAVFAEEVELWPHRRYPLAEMQRLRPGDGRLLDVVFNYLDFHVLDRDAVDTANSSEISPNEFPLAVSTEGGSLVITARGDAIGRPHGELLSELYRAALTAMAADPHGDARCSLLPPAHRERLLVNGTGPQVPACARAVHELVAEQVTRVPDTVAVRAPDGELTYAGLGERSSAWAAGLRDLGVERGDLVALCLPRGTDLVAAVLGVLSVGAAYVPLDPRHPEGRLSAMMRDASVSAVVTTPAIAATLPDDVPATVAPPSGRPQAAVISPGPDEAACLIHTSGSTGRPKGVLVRHGALTDRVLANGASPGLGADDVVAAVVPFITDVAQLDLFGPLTCGGTVVLAEEDFARDPSSLADLVREAGVTWMQATPTTWQLLVESGWSPPPGFRLVSGGEAMPRALLDRLTGEAEVWDVYGPNEATIFCFGTRIAEDGSRAEWVPARNTSAYVLNPALEPVPAGVPGEVHVGGAGLALGYLDRPGHTAGSFRPDPFTSTPGGRLYATGDLGRCHPDGRIEILGRVDHQVKIRGFRVEVGEVENTLAEHPDVHAAVVHPVSGTDGSPMLGAFLVPEHGALATDELREFAARALPDHLVPSFFVPMEAFPTLPNGKVDRAALPVPDSAHHASAEYVAPEGPEEELLARLWAEVLELDRVGRDEDFFALGGHSLLMMRIIVRLREDHGIDLTFRDFLEQRTVRGIAATVYSSGARSPLLWLSRSGEREPLFCVHPGGGSGHWYRTLADVLAPERPLAAFEWPGLHGDLAPAGNVGDIAGLYLDAMRAARPSGPYHLLGWCGSSGIAWEMAHRLRAAGERVELMLLDPVLDVSERDNEAHLRKLAEFRRAETLFATLHEDRPAAELDAVRAELVTELLDIVDEGGDEIRPEDIGEAWAYRLRSWRSLLEARLSYSFDTYPGTVHLILCDELAQEKHESIHGQSYPDYLRRWRELTSGEVLVHRIAGDHLGVLREPHVTELASTLTELIGHDHGGTTP
ncbi:amino acid adenylation domain-containing protein [Prauserella cavernicola]|uniref:Amino acid adenylation domain-containing protein n=1 Tax=Prauserella cavernicola TaxID=2800127 RepID=A0A934V415_9PSEU|nr:non-ribosomal peptide synthetase [Prauserella cavernicola]MBK1787886.1 amino acid adenylation domain-containing protein [Prauserella cavernicola]